MTGRLHDFTNAGGAATAPGGAGANAGRCRGHARGVIGRWLLRCAAVVLLFGAAAAQAAITITPTSFAAAAPRFYTDTDVALRCNYEAFAVNSTLALADAWVRIESFGGGNLALGGADDGIYRLGAFTAGQTKTAFFYVCSSFTKVGGTKTAAGQTFSVNVYGSNPAAGGVSALQTSSYSLTIDDSSGANNSSTVSVIVAGPNPAVLGGVITMTVNGSGGNLGGSQPFAITPAAYTTWRADAFELFATNLSFAGSNSGSFDNQLYFGTLGAGATTYTATYYFRAVATTTAPAALSPIAYVDTSTSHTSTTNGVYSTALLPMDPATNALSLAKLVNTATLPAAGGGGELYAALDQFISVCHHGRRDCRHLASGTCGGELCHELVYAGRHRDWQSRQQRGCADLVWSVFGAFRGVARFGIPGHDSRHAWPVHQHRDRAHQRHRH